MKIAIRYARNCLAMVMGFAFAASTLSAFVGPLRVAHLGVKLDWLAAHPADYDIVVIGSSRMRQVVPAVLDGELAAAGIRARTFNLSADGMRPPEDAYVLDRFMESRTGSLKFILMEANPIALRINEEDEETARFIHWHDTPRILTIWRRAFSHSIGEPPWIGKWISDTWRSVRFAARHTAVWVRNSGRLGRGSDSLLLKLKLERPPKFELGMGDLNDGYIPPKDLTPMTAAEAKGYRHALEKKLRLGADLDPMDGASQGRVARAAELARRLAARLVIVAPPATTVQTFKPIFPPGSNALFIDLSDPSLHPKLFDPPVRRDGSHLTVEGSHLFTQMIAQQLVAALQAGGEETPGETEER